MSDTVPQDAPKKQRRRSPPRTYKPDDPIFYVYLIARNGVPCYFGKGHGNRVNDHFYCAEHRKSCRHISCRVIRKAWRNGNTMTAVKILDGLTEPRAFAFERFLIRYGRQHGWPIYNLTDGGEGTVGYKYTPEQREARSALTKSYINKPEIKEAIRKAKLGRKPTEAEQAKRSLSLKLAYINDPELHQRKSEASRRMWETPEHQAKMREIMQRPEVKAKQRTAMLGKIPANTKTYPGFLAPDGNTIYENVFNLAAFCREHGLSKPKMCLVAQGKRKSHQGWTLYPPLPEKEPTYYHTAFRSPSGEIVDKIESLVAFCRENGLQHSNMTLVAQGEQESHKGWTRHPPLPVKPRKPTYTGCGFLSPLGIPHFPAHLTEFCVEHNLNPACMSDINNGRLHQHRGWTRYNPDDKPVQGTLF